MTPAHIVYRLIGHGRRAETKSLPPKEIDLSHIPMPAIRRILHAGPGNQLLERRHINAEKAQALEAFCGERLDTKDYRWEFVGQWSDKLRPVV